MRNRQLQRRTFGSKDLMPSKVNLLRCCLSDFNHHIHLMEAAMRYAENVSNLDSDKRLFFFQVFKNLMRMHDLLQAQLVGRELLRLKREAARRGLSPYLVSYMLPALLQWWEKVKTEKNWTSRPATPSPIRSVRESFCRWGPLVPKWGTGQPLNRLASQSLSADRLAAHLLSPEGPRGACPHLSFPWAQLLAAASAAGGTFESFLKEASLQAAQRALNIAQRTTRIEVYESHAAAAAAAGEENPRKSRSYLIAELEGHKAIEDASPEALKDLIRDGKEKRQKAIDEAVAMTKEAEEADKRNFLLSKIKSLDVCLASLAALG